MLEKFYSPGPEKAVSSPVSLERVEEVEEVEEEPEGKLPLEQGNNPKLVRGFYIWLLVTFLVDVVVVLRSIRSVSR